MGSPQVCTAIVLPLEFVYTQQDQADQQLSAESTSFEFTNLSRSSSDNWSIRMSHGHHQLNRKIRGKVRFAEDDSNVLSILWQGYLEVNQDDGEGFGNFASSLAPAVNFVVPITLGICVHSLACRLGFAATSDTKRGESTGVEHREKGIPPTVSQSSS
ncbi:MAG: hypothetical protein M2R45_04627 [Verrucomicrobia subdivision 3 bacterium]|nr:hypothetical protein [Limisphaerales bacterium]MCS1417119.1 hypothetical protein [Limisphaerales bacterium]